MKQLFLLLTLLIILLISCDTTEPIVDNTKPGRRDYIWTVDTLDTPYNPYYRMWGNTTDDVWLVSAGAWDKSIGHYNGINWSTYGIPGMSALHSVYGFAKDEIFIGTSGSQIWQYDGDYWSKFADLGDGGQKMITFDNIWGESSNDFYAFGAYPDDYGFNNSVIAHYKNNEWKFLNTEDLYGIVEHLYKNASNGRIYLQVIEIGGSRYIDSTHIYESVDDTFKNIYTSAWIHGEQADISLINDEVYFVLGNQISVRRNNKFQTVVNVNNPNFYQRIWGRSSKDIFLLMTDGLAHYNGSDIQYLFYFDKTPRTQIFGSALFNEEVFFLVYEGSTGLNMIYHGKAKE